MLIIKGKKYETLFFDWLDTLYSTKTDDLFPWVSDYFKFYSDLTNNYLITNASSIAKRSNTINSVGLESSFEKIYFNSGSKEKVFKDIIEIDNLDTKGILVIGDNYSNELHVAKILGLDSMHIDQFALIAQKLIRMRSK